MTVDRRRYPGSAHLKPQLSLCWCIQLDQQSMKVGQNGSAHFKPQLSLCWYIQLDQQSMKVGQNGQSSVWECAINFNTTRTQ
uniref:C2 NT-type domain-containing protein n=1 Tax=Heterorhabditis bacteriophora TaxID=37862 RepID=A0A1I7WSU2_HETBA